VIGTIAGDDTVFVATPGERAARALARRMTASLEKRAGRRAHEPDRARNIVVTTDRSRLDLDVIHGFLTTSYWARGVPREIVARSMEHSLCFGAFDEDRQVGFARVISDRATFAYICDVFTLESHRATASARA